MSVGGAAWKLALLAAVAGAGVGAVQGTRFDHDYRAGRSAYRAGRYAEAADRFERARERREGDSEVWAWEADAAAAAYRGRTDAAMLDRAWAGYAGAVLRSPLDTWSWSGIAETAIRRAAVEDAARGVDLATLDRRSRGIADPWRGAALVAAKTAVMLKPSGFLELDVLSKVHRSMGQIEAAQETIVRSARMMPAPSFHEWGGGERLVKPLYDAIIQAAREGVEATPPFERAHLHRDIARFALDQGDFENALAEFRSSEIGAEPESLYQTWRGEGQVLEALGRNDESIAAWDRVIATPWATAGDRRQRGGVLLKANRNADACRDLRDAVREMPEDDGARLYASSTCESAGEIETAERLLRDGFAVPTDNPQLARSLVDFYVRTGKGSTAEGTLHRWMRDYPEREDFRQWAAELASPR